MSFKLGRVAPFLMLGLAACATAPKVTEQGYLIEVPEEVRVIAAPYQNLNAIKLNPEDGCYWYQHENAVEYTMLPLRTAGGNPICSQVALDAVQTAAAE
ncbi:hypothetical protein HJ526_04535 [Donghicola sp. C2-DW-16]|uniref:Lipoprotein n=1 Tax=Donghicola mangrovi TaxID=2729614 RepID=A0A850PY00_9RHOB|nr:hypothetical protein [Donghicola mangrovi]NVO21733.1 hypothetical protein [Donghicola mangrovi]NVO26678.1 hypothetical protein [Donghicola mangrovi]